MERNGMNLFRVEKTRVDEVDVYVIVCGKYRASRRDFLSKEEAETYIEKRMGSKKLRLHINPKIKFFR